jgi:hypothetical protein
LGHGRSSVIGWLSRGGWREMSDFVRFSKKNSDKIVLC